MNILRNTDIVRLLIRYPMTAEMIFCASRNFEKPYTNYSQVKTDLAELIRRGFLNRQEVPATGRGQKRFLYFLKRKAALLVPEVEDVGRSSAVFRGFTEAPWHTLAVSEFMSRFEASAGQLPGRVKILASIRPRYFEANVVVETARGREATSLVPDYTHIVELDGVFNLLFFELQHKAAVICPVSPQSLNRSFKFKLAKYKAFQRLLQGHHLIQHLQKVLGCRFPGFRVLVATTKSELNRRNLMECARGYKKMFYFTTMEEAARMNLFSEPAWSLPAGHKRALLD